MRRRVGVGESDGATWPLDSSGEWPLDGRWPTADNGVDSSRRMRRLAGASAGRTRRTPAAPGRSGPGDHHGVWPCEVVPPAARRGLRPLDRVLGLGLGDAALSDPRSLSVRRGGSPASGGGFAPAGTSRSATCSPPPARVASIADAVSSTAGSLIRFGVFASTPSAIRRPSAGWPSGGWPSGGWPTAGWPSAGWRPSRWRLRMKWRPSLIESSSAASSWEGAVSSTGWRLAAGWRSDVGPGVSCGSGRRRASAARAVGPSVVSEFSGPDPLVRLDRASRASRASRRRDAVRGRRGGSEGIADPLSAARGATMARPGGTVSAADRRDDDAFSLATWASGNDRPGSNGVERFGSTRPGSGLGRRSIEVTSSSPELDGPMGRRRVVDRRRRTGTSSSSNASSGSGSLTLIGPAWEGLASLRDSCDGVEVTPTTCRVTGPGGSPLSGGRRTAST
jgi:hypothetical protein